MYPSHYKYTKEHRWLNIDGNIATVGITEYAQQQLGEIVFVSFEEVNKTIEAGGVFGTVESVKATLELIMPMTGTILETNDALVNNPEILNVDPHGDGWVIKIQISNMADINQLLSVEEYTLLLSV
jgi:glycine cleavage system H protein